MEEFQLYGLFEAFEPPLSFRFFEAWYGQEFGDGVIRIALLGLLRIVVFIFDIYIARILILVVFVLEVVAIGTLVQSMRRVGGEALDELLVGLLHEIIIRHGD